jgi:hypothetical protein
MVDNNTNKYFCSIIGFSDVAEEENQIEKLAKH